MQWPAGVDPLKLPRFEMLARARRYQLIAKAALRGRIRHLFLGHHLDDQVETIMMRLIRNTNISFLGLKGMAEKSIIPCCENIRGANESIEFCSIEEYLSQDETLNSDQRSMSSIVNNGRLVSVADSHGLQLHRPLLGFSKSELINTCRQRQIRYVSDKTNFDPTITMRNAIRHMRTNHNLPRALQATPILQLMGKARQHSQSLNSRADELLSHAQVVEFDLRIGSMTIKLPQPFAAICKTDMEAASNVLSRLTSAISPQHREGAGTLIPEVRCQEFIKTLSSDEEAATLQIQQTQIDRLSGRPGLKPGETLWRLSRPPLREAEVQAAEREFEPAVDNPKENTSGIWSEWILWDHRYWIRVKAHSAEKMQDIGIRNYRATDNDRIRSGVSKYKEFRATIKDFAPGKMMRNLPVLTDGNLIAAFPTMNVRIHETAGEEENPRRPQTDYPIMEWECCYKALDQAFVQDQKSKIVWKNA